MPRKLLSISFLLQLVPTIASDVQTIPSGGKPSCPCMPYDGNNSDYHLEGCLRIVTSSGIYCRNLDYGSKCDAWDLGLQPSCNTGDQISALPSWCERSWCLVDRNNCEEPSSHLTWLPGQNLYYSYETCGSTNEFIKEDLKNGLRGKELRFAFPIDSPSPGNPWHYKRPEDGQWDGLMYQMMMEIQNSAGFTLVERSVSNISLNKYASKWDACLHDIELGLIDVCPTACQESRGRLLRVTFGPELLSSELKLLVPKVLDDEFWLDKTLKAFKPFKMDFYFFILGVIIVTAASFYIFEGDPDGEEDFDEVEGDELKDESASSMENGQDLSERSTSTKSSSFVKRFMSTRERLVYTDDMEAHHIATTLCGKIVNVFYHVTLGFCLAEVPVEARTLPGRLIKLAFAFFILVTIASYTANLAAWLMDDQAEHRGIQNIDDCIVQQIPVCVENNFYDNVRIMYPSLKMVRKKSSKDTMKGLRKGDCGASLIPTSDYETRLDFQNCSEIVVPEAGAGVMSFSIASPVAERYVRSWSYHTSTLAEQGVFKRLHHQYKSRKLEACSKIDEEGGQDKSLDYHHFSGVWILWGACVFAAWVLRILAKTGKCPALTVKYAQRDQRERKEGLKKMNRVIKMLDHRRPAPQGQEEEEVSQTPLQQIIPAERETNVSDPNAVVIGYQARPE